MTRLARAALLLAAAALPLGCSLFSGAYDKVTGKPDFKPVSQEELFAEITSFVNKFTYSLQQTATRIDQENPDVATRRATLQWRIRSVQDMQSILGETDAKRALTDLWVTMLQVQAYLKSDAAKQDFKVGLADVQAASAELLESVEEIAATVIAPKDMPAAKKELQDFVAEHPMKNMVSGVLGAQTAADKGTMRSIVSAPLAPFKAFEGVSEGAAAIREFALIGNRFATIIQGMPQQLAWQVDLMLLDLDESPAMASLIHSVAQATAASASIAETASTLTANVGKELRTTLDEVATQQPELQKTLVSVDAALKEANTLAVSFDATATSLTKTAEAVQATVGSIDKAFLQPSPPPPKGSPPPTPSRPFDITEYTATADSLTQAAVELRKTVAQVQTLLDDADAKSPEFEAVANDLITRATWSLAAIVVLALAAAIVHRLVVRRLPAPRS